MLKANRLLLLFLLLLSFTLAGCKGETKAEDNVIELTEEEEAQLSEDLQAQDALETIALESEPLWVVANGGLKMRENFNLDSKEIMVIPDGELVTAIERKLLEEEIAGVKGYWTKVNYQRENGWVFGGFLSEQDPNKDGAIDEKMLIGAWYRENEDSSFVYMRFLENNVFLTNSGLGLRSGKWNYDKESSVIYAKTNRGSYNSKVLSLNENELEVTYINTNDSFKYKKVNSPDEIKRLEEYKD